MAQRRSNSHDDQQVIGLAANTLENRESLSEPQRQFLDVYHSVRSAQRNGIPHLWLHYDLNKLASALGTWGCVRAASVVQEIDEALRDISSSDVDARFSERWKDAVAHDFESLAELLRDDPNLLKTD